MLRFTVLPSFRIVARRAAIFAIAIMCIAGVAEAMRVSPMVVEMTTTGAGSTARVEVQNLDSANLPFETRVSRIDYDAQGNMTETPADGDFLVFPPQGLLPQGGRQVVRLQWVGGADLPASRGYYLSVNQIPVSFAAGDQASAGAQVQVVYHMKVLVTVAPPNAQPKVELVSAKPVAIAPKPAPGEKTATGPTTPGVEVTVRNTGNRYAMMAGATWSIEGIGADGKPLKVTLNHDDLSRDIGAGYLAPLNGVRTFQVPTGQAFGSAPIKVKFTQ
jgi:fimbrial chaperone protein